VRARRQPGSAFKPFVYAAALSRGYSPVSVLDLRDVEAPGNPEWTAGRGAAGQPDALTLRAALLESNNRAAVDLQQRVGTRVVRNTGEEAGLRDLPDVPSLALGTGLVSPLDLTAAYTIFPGGGVRARPRGIVSVTDAAGTVVFEQPPSLERVVSEDVAYQMVTMLEDVIDRGTGRPARSMGVKGAVAGKTGTTDDYRDAWFVGFSSSVVAGVWVGFDRPAPIGESAYGARIALPIWAEFMNAAAGRYPPRDFPVPDTLEPEELCQESYLRPVDGCPTYVEYFKDADGKPSAMCSLHKGSLKQRAARAVQGFLRSLGDRLSSIFD
jgi:penicillin-binding protein 1A